MNFGLTFFTLAYIVFLLVPGTFFKRFYFQSKFQQQFNVGSFADKFITSIFWGFLIQILCVSVFKFSFDYSFDQLYQRACNLHDAISKNNLPGLSYKQLKYLLLILTISIVVSCLLGHILHKLLRFFKLDVLFSPLRFSNEWNYIFRNELSRNNLKDDDHKKRYHSTEVDLIVNESKDDKPNFYSGVLQDYYLNDEGQLDRICLKLAKKRVKCNDGSVEFKEINGDTFIIPYSTISNMNLRFNYIYKEKGWKVPESIKNTILLLLMLVLIGILILPWFADTSLFNRSIAIILLMATWTSLVAMTTDILNEKSELKTSIYIFFISMTVISSLGALNLLGIFNIFEFIQTNLQSFSLF